MGLIFLVWMVYFALYAPKPQPQPTEITSRRDSAVEFSGAAQEEIAERTPAGDLAGEEDRLLSAVTAEDLAGAPGAESVDTVVVTTDLYRYHFITRGGILVRAYLKKYPSFRPNGWDETGETPSVQLIPTRNSRFLASRIFFQKGSVDLSSLIFRASTYSLTLDSLRDEGSVTFTRRLQGGRELKMVYLFRNDSYKIDVNLDLPKELRQSGENRLEVELGPTLVSNEKDPEDSYGDYDFYGIVYGEQGGEIITKSLKRLFKSYNCI